MVSVASMHCMLVAYYGVVLHHFLLLSDMQFLSRFLLR